MIWSERFWIVGTSFKLEKKHTNTLGSSKLSELWVERTLPRGTLAFYSCCIMQEIKIKRGLREDREKSKLLRNR